MIDVAMACKDESWNPAKGSSNGWKEGEAAGRAVLAARIRAAMTEERSIRWTSEIDGEMRVGGKSND